MGKLTRLVIVHVIRFRRVNQHATRALCNCGWHAATGSRRTFAQLAELVTTHAAANLTGQPTPQT